MVSTVRIKTNKIDNKYALIPHNILYLLNSRAKFEEYLDNIKA